MSKANVVDAEMEAALVQFCRQHNIHEHSFGAVCTMIYVTRQARRCGLPLLPQRLINRSGTQVAGLHRNAVQAVLSDHGIDGVHLGEVGRTNPNNVTRARAYIMLLNGHTDLDHRNLAHIEQWWVAHLPARPPIPPLKLRWQVSRSAAWMVGDLLAQLQRRYRQSWRSEYKIVIAGLTAALLWQEYNKNIDAELPLISELPGAQQDLEVRWASSSAFVTHFPAAALLHNIEEQRRRRRHVFVVTCNESLNVINQGLAEADLQQHVNVLAIEQWLAIVPHRLGLDDDARDGETVRELVAAYNRIADSLDLIALPRLVVD